MEGRGLEALHPPARAVLSEPGLWAVHPCVRRGCGGFLPRLPDSPVRASGCAGASASFHAKLTCRRKHPCKLAGALRACASGAHLDFRQMFGARLCARVVLLGCAFGRARVSVFLRGFVPPLCPNARVDACVHTSRCLVRPSRGAGTLPLSLVA